MTSAKSFLRAGSLFALAAHVGASPASAVELPAMPTVEPGVIDAAYVARYARPPQPQALAFPSAGLRRQPLAPPGLASAGAGFATSQHGNILVIEGTSGNGGSVVQTGNGLAFDSGNGIQAVLQQVYARLGDQFDFISVYTTFDDYSAAAYYLPLQNDTEGLGRCNFQSGETFGCTFNNLGFESKLQGFVYMNSLNTWAQWDYQYDGVEHPIDDFDSAIYSTLGQEIAHRWGSGLRFVDPRSGSVSTKLLGRDNSHWAAWVDTDASVMDGWDWSADGDRFVLENDMDRYSTLDLYSIGALPVAEAKPFFFIDNAVYDENDGLNLDGQRIAADAVLASGIPSIAYLKSQDINLGGRGERVDLTIQDIVDAEGNRCPDPDHTQKAYRQLIVLLTRPGQTAAQAQSYIDDLEVVATRWEDWWRDRTGKAITLCTGLDVSCQHAEGRLSGATIPETIAPGSSAAITVSVSALVAADVTGAIPFEGGALKNARIEVRLDGNGADKTTLESTSIPVGDVEPGQARSVDIPFSIASDYGCSTSVVIVADLVSDNAKTVTERYRLFPGTRAIYEETFGSDTDEFTINKDGQDEAARGWLGRSNVALSCSMSERSPERDASPDNQGAYVTGVGNELQGDTSLWSPEIDLSGAVHPTLRYDFWLDGKEGDQLVVQVSRDGGDKFRDAVTETISDHVWSNKLVDLTELFDGETPQSVIVRFIFVGNGHLEGGIDNFRILDTDGQCAVPYQAVCGCSVDGGAGPQASVVLAAAAFGIAVRVRRRRRA